MLATGLDDKSFELRSVDSLDLTCGEVLAGRNLLLALLEILVVGHAVVNGLLNNLVLDDLLALALDDWSLLSSGFSNLSAELLGWAPVDRKSTRLNSSP